MAAMMRLIPTDDFDHIVAEMNESIQEVVSGEITTATRNVEINGVNVNEGEIIALHNRKLVTSASNLEDGVMNFLKQANVEEYELITLFFGESVTKKQVNQIVDKIHVAYPDQEVEVQDGGQPHYHFIISLE